MTPPGLWRTIVQGSDWEWYCDNCGAGEFMKDNPRESAIAHTQATQHQTRAFWTNRHVFTGAELPCQPALRSSSSPTSQG